MLTPLTRPFALVALLLVTILVVSSACGTQTAGLAPTSTPFPTDAPEPTQTPIPEWVTHTVTLADGVRTYKIDMPGVLQCGAASALPGYKVFPCYYDHSPLPANHPAIEELQIEVEASIVPDQTMSGCNGTPITVDSNITGLEAFKANDTCDGTEPPDARVFWKTPGVCYELMATTNYAGSEDFNTRYGAAWQHILASFVPPSPPPSGGTTCS